MANYIFKNGVEILRCSNWAMDVLYENFKDIVQLEGLSNNELLLNFLEKLDQGVYGRGCVYVDITNFFNCSTHKLPITVLIDLVEKTINKIKNNRAIDISFVNILEEFKNKI